MKKQLLTWMLGFGLLLAGPLTLAAVNLNKDSADAIAKELKGVGKARAEAIVKERKKHGPFKDEKDLQKRVKGIGPGTIKKNKGKLHF